MGDGNVVNFPVKKHPVGMDDILGVLTESKENFKTLFVIGLTKSEEVFITHTPFTDEELVFFAKILDVYSNQVIESIIDDSVVSFLPDGG